MGILFDDRRDAGRKLASKLQVYAAHPAAIVLGLPRGGVPVADEVAKALELPLDILTVRKLGVPGQPELAMGAVASGNVRVLDDGIIGDLRISEAAVAAVTLREQRELHRREQLYRGDRPFPDLRDQLVILVDDGLATGSTMRAAIAAVRIHRPARVIVASPVGSRWVCRALRQFGDDVICYACPETFQAVSEFYDDFEQTTDDELSDIFYRPAAASPSLRPIYRRS